MLREFTTDGAIVLFYLLFTMSIGYFSGRKVQSFRQYAVHDNEYHTFVLVATIFATMIGGNSIIGSVTESFSNGIVYSIVTLGFVIKPLVISECVAPQIKKYFNKAISIGDVFKDLYGTEGKVIAGISICLNSIACLAAQIFAIGSILSYFLEISFPTSMVIGYGIIIFYSTFGGINAVVKTDLFQFAILIIAIPILYTESLERIGGYSNLFNSLPETHLSFTYDKMKLYDHIALCLTFCLFFITPTLIQRVMLSSDSQQATKSFRIASFIGIFLALVLILIGLTGYVINPKLSESNILFYLIDEIMPVGLRGIIISGLIAVIMSTADSYLNVSSVAIVNDVVKPCFGNLIKEDKQLLVARSLTLLLGISTLFIALSHNNFVKIVVFSAYFWITILLVPFIAGIWGFILRKKHFFACVAFGAITSIFWNLYFTDEMQNSGVVIITIMDTILFIALYQFGGRRITHSSGEKKIDNGDKNGTKTPRDKIKKYLVAIKNNVILPFSIYRINDYIQNKVRYYGRQYYLTFGFAGIAIYILPYFMWSYNGTIRYMEIALRIIACSLCFCLVIWAIKEEDKNKNSAQDSKYLPFYWYFTLLFCLPFLSTYLTIDSQGEDNFWILNMIVSTFILTLLVDWVSFIFIMILGVSIAFSLQNLIYDQFSRIEIMNYDYVIYAAVCTSTLSYFILYFREVDLKRLTRITSLLKNAVSELKSNKVELENKNQEMLAKNEELEDTKLRLKEANVQLIKNVEEKTTHLETALNKNQQMNKTLEKSHNDNINTDRKLAKALDYKKEVFHNISHEVRTPIQGIISISEVLQGQWENFNDSQKLEYVNMIAQSGHRLMTFLSDLLEIAKFDSGKMLLEFQPNSLIKKTEEIIEECRALCINKNSWIRLEIEKNIDDRTIFDSLRIKQVIRNLVSNAIKYSGSGEILVRIHNKSFRMNEKEITKKHLCFSVIDKGIGIAKEDLVKIFEPFQQGSNTKTGAGGTGLGLSICQSIISYHNGVIWAENNLDKGVTFSFTLPYLNQNKESVNLNKDPIEDEKIQVTALIIEDEKILRNALNMVISSYGVKVIEAEGAVEALKILYQYYDSIDVILMDMMMPDMYGLDLIEAINKENLFKEIPIILQSGMVDVNEIHKAFEMGVVDHITKPYKKESIIQTIKKACSKVKAQ